MEQRINRTAAKAVRLPIKTTAEAEAQASESLAVLGDLPAWLGQAQADYRALFMALPVIRLQGDAAAAMGDRIGVEALADFGLGLANIRDRAEWLVGLAEAAARRIGAILAAREGGHHAAMEIFAALPAGGPESTADDEHLIRACLDAGHLDSESQGRDEAADASDNQDPDFAARCRADAARLAGDYQDKIREIATLPAAGRGGEAAKARLLLDLVSTEPDGSLPKGGFPADLLAFSLASDVLRTAPMVDAAQA
jgi:hypothetical protein